MADSFTPNIAPQTDDGGAPEQAQPQPDATEAVPITEQEVGEYREQDRYLPVSPSIPLHLPHFSLSCAHNRLKILFNFLSAFWPPLAPPPLLAPPKKKDRKRFAYHEERRATNG
jgi:hypothetical protein